ncbi:MAG: cytochrome C [Deltaproteobacteria bacterium]|nr:MAG: cytochrome C [Deltaproteobacteria bacterium]
MSGKKLTAIIIFFLAAIIVTGCAVTNKYSNLPKRHPETIERPQPTCTQCHTEEDPTVDFKSMAHRQNWVQTHRLPAYSNERVCEMCHAQSFCTDCHQTRTELKPSLRHQTETQRAMIHRGDYLPRHSFDGKLNPVACFRCHGNPKSSETCRSCHGR